MSVIKPFKEPEFGQTEVLDEGNLPDSARSQMLARTKLVRDILSYLHPEGLIKVSPLGIDIES